MSKRPNRMLDEEEEIALDAPQPTAAEEVRVKHSKISASLAPKLYYGLVDFCTSASRSTGAKVTHVDVIRILVAELAASEELRARVVAQLRKR